VAKRASNPALADAGRAHDILRKNNPLRLSSDIRIIHSPETHLKALAKAIAALGAGDVLLVTRRLARSTRDLLNILDVVSKAGAKFRSLNDAWADTTTPHGELIVTILVGLATFERHLINARTDEGRKRAQARGGSVRQKAQALSVPDRRGNRTTW
jgi:DNA invertase Pin-like site-specific DNA recombinase